MARLPRIDFPEARHHVMNRGARRQDIFLDDGCYSVFLELLGRAVERYGVRVHGFALMSNHFHLMAESVRGNLSGFMQFLSSRYSSYLGEHRGWSGPVYDGRYRNKLVLADEYWMYLLAYLHLNPVRARIVMRADQAKWTSHKAYANKTKKLDWLTTSELCKYFEPEGGYRKFLKSVVTKKCLAPVEFDQVLFELRNSGKLLVTKQEPVGKGIEIEQALAEVMYLTGETRETLLSTQRGRGGNPGRALAVWWLVHGAGLSNVKAGEVLNMSPVAVSKILAKIRENPREYAGGKLVKWMEALR
jgi:REP element-mobilizing transposase RayT